MGQEADLENLGMDELYVLRLVTGTSDSKLREEFLRQEKPSRESLVLLAKSRETAQSVEKSIQKSSFDVHVDAVSSYKKAKAGRPLTRRDWKNLHGNCNGCGKNCSTSNPGQCPARREECYKCGKIGHFSKVCMSREKRGTKPTYSCKNSVLTVNSSEAEPIHNSLIQVQSVSSSKFTPRAEIEAHPNEGTSFRLQVLPDTGATETLISHDLVQKFKVPIDETQRRQIKAANGSELRCAGAVYLRLVHLGKYEAHVSAFVTPDIRDQLILSWHNMIPLGMIPSSFPLLPKDVYNARANAILTTKHNNKDDEDDIFRVEGEKEINQLISCYPTVFDSSAKLKPMTGKPMKIHLNPNVEIVPTFTTAVRNVALANRDKFEAEMDFMQKSDIIEAADEPTDWVSPSIVVPKANGSVRLVVDYTGLNRYVKRPVHPFPSPHELASSIPSTSKWFATFDAVKGYWQVELDKDSRHLTTFLTPLGRFRFCRAPMGLNASGDEYCARGDRALAGIVGVKKIVDDILVFAPTLSELQARIKSVLLRCKDAGITLSKDKIQIGKSVTFAGFIISDGGIQPK